MLSAEFTARQIKFIDAMARGESQVQSYMDAGYIRGVAQGRAAQNADKLLAQQPHIAAEICRRQQALADGGLWDRQQALTLLIDIAYTAQRYMVFKKYQVDPATKESSEIDCFDPSVANSMAKAIDQANKMCGFNEPDKAGEQEKGFEVTIKNAEDNDRAECDF